MNHSDSRAYHRCFKDKALIDFIRKKGQRGWCDWCGARNVYVIPLYELGDIFREAVSIYQPGDWDDDSKRIRGQVLQYYIYEWVSSIKKLVPQTEYRTAHGAWCTHPSSRLAGLWRAGRA